MSIVSDVMQDELKRNLEMQIAYNKEITSLPKGTIISKKIRNREYLYLLYRADGKVRTDYIGSKEKVLIDDIQKKIDKRKYYQTTLKKLLKEEQEIRRVLKYLS